MKESIRKVLNEIISNPRMYSWSRAESDEKIEIVEDMTNQFQELLDNDKELNYIKSTGIITGIDGYIREQKFRGMPKSMVECRVYVLVPFKFMEDERILDIAIGKETEYGGIQDLKNLIFSKNTLGPLNIKDRVDDWKTFTPTVQIKSDK